MIDEALSTETKVTSSDDGTPRLGAYGLRLNGVDDASSQLLVDPAEGWATVEVVRRRGRLRAMPTVITADRAEFPLTGSGRLVVHRTPRRATFTTSRALSDDELVHPYLAPAAAAFARWDGREAFHAGAFVHGDRAWALVGTPGSGKSSTLAALAHLQHDILCDDLLITDFTSALAGPRCLDLRWSSAQRFPWRHRLTRERQGRWRLRVKDVPPEVPLGGWVFLEWGAETAIKRVEVSDRLPRLAAHRSMLTYPANPAALLDAAALPAWELTRPPAWESLPDTLSELLRAASESP